MGVADWPELEPEWPRLDALLAREVARMRARYQLSLDETRGLYISDAQVDGLVADGASPAEAAPALEGSVAPAPGSPLAHLGAVLALSPLEIDLVWLALAPEIDPKYATLFAYLHDDVTRRSASGELALRLLRDEGVRGRHLLAALSADGPLLRLGVLRLIDAAASGGALAAGYALERQVLHFLTGVGALPPALVRCVRRLEAAAGSTAPATTLLRRTARLPLLFQDARGEAPLVILLEPAGGGATAAAAALGDALRLPVLEVDLGAFTGESAPVLSAALALEVRLSPAVVLLRASGGERPLDTAGTVRALRDARAPTLLACEADAPWRELARSVRSVVVDLCPGDFTERLAVWEQALVAGGVELDRAARGRLAGRFAFAPRHAELCISAAHDLCALDDDAHPDMEARIGDSARRLLDQRLGKLASKVVRQWTWSDLVLPELTRARLEEMSAAIRLRHLVYDEWQLGRRVGGSGGVKALFAGASGTGKTMSASVLASDLGFDLYRIDLSGVVSKYIGETEKNLDEIFRSAGSGHAILFFDEADALFGKRSEVKDAHDRYANVEAAYLLQKLEEHDGVVILASNLKRNIDAAFARRLQYVVEFPVPDVPERVRLWRGMFPAAVPLAADIDFAFLGRQFAISGGDIKNVALEASFLAAQEESRVSMRHLVRATARQLVKQGRQPSSQDFQQYHRWVACDA